MKSPTQLQTQLSKQWQSAARRGERLGEGGFPFSLSIGIPSPSVVQNEPQVIRDHLAAWRTVMAGQVIWQAKAYRALGGEVELPTHWTISSAEEWASGCCNASVAQEIRTLVTLLAEAPLHYHDLLIRRKSLWTKYNLGTLRDLIEVCEHLTPGCCQGAPLRAYPLSGLDTKFIETHRVIITALLEERYPGRVKSAGLESFLGASDEQGHWILLADLDGGLLPLPQMRARTSDLTTCFTTAQTIVIVENEKCLHQLPSLRPDTLAVLGAGLDLQWTSAEWLRDRTLYYWGDLDTWGLSMLATVRQYQPHVIPLMMTRQVLDEHRSHAVREPVPHEAESHAGLSPEEQALYTYLQSHQLRLEQEFLSPRFCAPYFAPEDQS